MKNRNENIDFYKGMLMFGVIWGHTITALRAGGGTRMEILTFFRTYDMPFFMLLSGYFFGFSIKKGWKKVAIDKLKNILLPLTIWEVIIMVITGSFPRFFSLWFLWCLVGTLGIVITVYALIHNDKFRFIIFLMIGVGFHVIPKNIFNLGYMFPFFIIGHYLPYISRKWNFNCWSLWKKVGIFLGFVILECFWKGEYNVWNAGVYVCLEPLYVIPVIIFRGTIGLIGCIVMKKIFDILFVFLSNEFIQIKDFFVLIGQKTFILYVLQSIIIERILSKIVIKMSDIMDFNIFTYNMNLLGYFFAPVIALTVMYLILIAMGIVKNYKWARFLQLAR